MLLRVLLSAILVLAVSGCATGRKGAVNLQLEQLQTKVSQLENELKQKEEEVNYLEEQLTVIQAKNITSAKKQSSAKSKSSAKLTPRNIQLALKNAGVYKGPIDGKIGKTTKKAIKVFQEMVGLKPDGVIGKQTSLKLKQYL